MSASLRTRDGSWSPVQAQFAREDAELGTQAIDASDLRKYASENKIDLIAGEPLSSQLARVNARRREWQLPVFVVRQQTVRPVPSPAPVEASVAAPKANAAPISSSSAAPQNPRSRAGFGAICSAQDGTPNAGGMPQPATEIRQNSGVSPRVEGRTPATLQDRQADRNSAGYAGAAAPVDTTGKPQPRAENVCSQAMSAPTPRPPIFADQDEFLRHVTDFDGTVTGLVTPEIADWILALNTDNRPLMRRKLQRFAALLRGGMWINTGEPLIISREAILNDGQHRLTGIKDTGIAAECDIRFGIPREAFPATGTGAPRNASDVLAIAGMKNTHLASAMAKIVYRYDANAMGDIERPLEHSVVLETAEATPLIGEIAEAIRLSKFKPTKTSAYGAMLVVAAEAAGKDRALAFHRLVEAGKADDTDPTAQLHVRLRNAAMEKTRMRPVEICVLTARAWNAWVQGRALTRLVVTDDDRTSSRFPRILG